MPGNALAVPAGAFRVLGKGPREGRAAGNRALALPKAKWRVSRPFEWSGNPCPFNASLCPLPCPSMRSRGWGPKRVWAVWLDCNGFHTGATPERG